MDGFKKFYNERKGKHILFFGFYIIFFIFLAIYIGAMNSNRPIDNNKEETVEKGVTTYNISNLINNDYGYDIEIIDDENTYIYSGTKNNVDYANYEHKYFLDIYNINQLLKRSTLVSNQNYILTYNLSNKELNDILLTDRQDGTNNILVYVNTEGEITKINIDLSNYLEKDVYQITIDYKVGDNNENSPS